MQSSQVHFECPPEAKTEWRQVTLADDGVHPDDSPTSARPSFKYYREGGEFIRTSPASPLTRQLRAHRFRTLRPGIAPPLAGAYNSRLRTCAHPAPRSRARHDTISMLCVAEAVQRRPCMAESDAEESDDDAEKLESDESEIDGAGSDDGAKEGPTAMCVYLAARATVSRRHADAANYMSSLRVCADVGACAK